MPESVSAKYRKPGSFIDEVLAGLRLAIFTLWMHSMIWSRTRLIGAGSTEV